MDRKSLVSIIAILVIVGSVISLYLNRPGAGSRVDFRPSQALGQVLAQETAQRLNHRGNIALIHWSLEAGELPRMEEIRTSFEQSLQRERGVAIAHTETIPAVGPPLAVLGSGLPSAAFLEILQNTPDIDAIVSLVGAPTLTREQVQRLDADRPKLIVVDVPSVEKVHRSGMRIESLIESNVIDLAIVGRAAPLDRAPAGSRGARRHFDRHFEIVRRSD